MALSTDDFPYTAGYVRELLGVEEQELLNYIQQLSIVPRSDEQTGSPIFSHRDIELLRKAIDMRAQGEELPEIVRQLGREQKRPVMEAYASTPHPGQTATTGNLISQVNRASNLKTGGKENISVIVEAVSQAKEGILHDIARLLDDKLAGLDEVVVELIRCKSENDSLKQKLKTAQSEVDELSDELSKFKPVQFGFYKKLP